MKSFLEEYGFAILAAIVVILLIAMATPVGNLIKTQIMNVVDSFANRTEAKLSAVNDGDVTATIVETPAGTAKVTILTVPSDTNTYKIRWSVNGEAFGELAALTKAQNAENFVGAYASQSAQSKQLIKYEIYDDGTGALVNAGSLLLK